MGHFPTRALIFFGGWGLAPSPRSPPPSALSLHVPVVVGDGIGAPLSPLLLRWRELSMPGAPLAGLPDGDRFLPLPLFAFFLGWVWRELGGWRCFLSIL